MQFVCSSISANLSHRNNRCQRDDLHGENVYRHAITGKFAYDLNVQTHDLHDLKVTLSTIADNIWSLVTLTLTFDTVTQYGNPVTAHEQIHGLSSFDQREHGERIVKISRT